MMKHCTLRSISTLALCAAALFSSSATAQTERDQAAGEQAEVRRAPPARIPGKLKVYISADMEGVAGAVTSDQLRPEGFEYERFRIFMTDETLAAVNAAKAAGATEILVSDSHGNGQNLLIERFPRDVRIVRSWPRPGEMMAGLDSTFDAALFIGYHASTTSLEGVRAHSFSSANYMRIALNGHPVSEGEFGAAYAGSLGVPVIFASGDDITAKELKARIGNIVTVETKKALGFHSAVTLTPEEANTRIANGVRSALARIRDFKPYVLKTPISLEIGFKNYMPGHVLSLLRTVERIDSHTVRFVARDMSEASDFLSFVGTYKPDLTP